MAETTQAIQLYPWPRGLNTSADALQIPTDQTQVCLNVQFLGTAERPGGVIGRGGLERQNAYDTASGSFVLVGGTAAAANIWGIDYWANVGSGSKQARFVVVNASRRVYVDDYTGQWAREITGTAVTLTSFGKGEVTGEVMNEDLILGFKNSTDSIAVWEAQSAVTDLVPLTATTGFTGIASGTLVSGIKKCWILRQHQSRMFYAGNPDEPDTLYYSAATLYNDFSTTATNSAGNIQIFPGDGDPVGITAIFPSINSQELYVAKLTKIYKVITSDPDPNNWGIVLVTDGAGCVNHNTARTIDQQDVYFESLLGCHSLLQILQDRIAIAGKLLSKDITPNFTKVINPILKPQHAAVYWPEEEAYILTCQGIGSSYENFAYNYHVETNQWSIWTNDAASAWNYPVLRYDPATGTHILYFLSNAGYINYVNLDSLNDFTDYAVSHQVTTAVLKPQDNTFLRESTFTDAFLLFKATTDLNFFVQYKIDNSAQNTESGYLPVFASNLLGTTLLGTGFILGVPSNTRPVPIPISGVGYGLTLSVVHSSQSEAFELYGLIVKYENAEESRDVNGLI